MSLEIESPITLIGTGRSGTTLIEKCFNGMPGVEAVGAVSGLIFGTYVGALSSYYRYNLSKKPGGFLARPDRAVAAVHDIYKYHLNINKDNKNTRWFQKPAGIPKFFHWGRYRCKDDRTAFPATWYWSTLKSIFPNSKYLIVLRNPWSVVLSRAHRDGWSQEESWEDILYMYDILRLAPDGIEIMFFDDLKNDPFSFISSLCSNYNLTIPENISSILDAKWGPTQKDSKFNYIKNNMKDIPDIVWRSRDLITTPWKEQDRFFCSFNKKYNFFD